LGQNEREATNCLVLAADVRARRESILKWGRPNRFEASLAPLACGTVITIAINDFGSQTLPVSLAPATIDDSAEALYEHLAFEASGGDLYCHPLTVKDLLQPFEAEQRLSAAAERLERDHRR
jgi:hypothetical protein